MHSFFSMTKQQALWFLAVFLAQGDAFTTTVPHFYSQISLCRRWVADFGRRVALRALNDQHDMATGQSTNKNSNMNVEQEQSPPCYYKSPSGRWKPRIELAELSIGQELPDAVVVQELLDGKTGPKVFVDCGVGRCKTRTRKQQQSAGWKIQTAMLRLNERKRSVAAKRVARLRQRQSFPVYVSRIRLDNDQLEVCLHPEHVVARQPQVKRISVANLKQGQECVGTVERVMDYGVLVDVGANRHGLLHIQRVADLNNRFVNKADGLVEAGLERGARIKVQVLEPVQKKRLFLDFTEDVKQSAREELEIQKQRQKEAPTKTDTTDTDSAVGSVASSDQTTEAAARTSSRQQQVEADTGEGDYFDEDDDDDDDDYDDYDEDRDIEDALGLGSY